MNAPPDDIDARREPLFPRNAAAEPLEPPAEIDRIVLARARAALRDTRSGEASQPAFFSLNQWAMPLGLAATVVLALAVIVRIGADAGAPAPGIVAEIDLRHDARDASTAAATPAATADAPMAESIETKPAGASRRARGVNEDRIVAQAALEAVREAEISNAASAQLPAAGPAQAPAPAPATLAAPAPPPAAGALADAAEDTRPMASDGAGLAMASNQASALRSEAADIHATPELWYRKIVELRNKGQQRAADREWRALKARYPDFTAPPRTTAQ